jgi:hypothetical protein
LSERESRIIGQEKKGAHRSYFFDGSELPEENKTSWECESGCQSVVSEGYGEEGINYASAGYVCASGERWECER